MTIQLYLLILCFIIYNCSAFTQFDSIAFKSDEIIPRIVNNSYIKKNYLCNKLYKNMVKNKFICVYPNDIIQNKNNFTQESKFIFESVKIIIETFLDKNSVENFVSTNNRNLNVIYSNYLLFYVGSIIQINDIIKNLLQYLTDKFILTYKKYSNFIKSKYSLDEKNELIILPIPSKIRYFTNQTLDKYDECLDFLNSLEDSVCFTTKIENIQKLNN